MGGGRIVELDGLRGLAILLVLVWHYIVPFFDSIPRALILTWSGVDLFFVLSGFLIGGILLDARHSPAYFSTFYARRVCRIFPLYFAWLGLGALGATLAIPATAHVFKGSIPMWSYPLFLQNLFMADSQTFGSTWLGITWSLAIEEQFYLLLPLVVRFLSVRKVAVLAGGAIVLAPLLREALYQAGNLKFAPYVLLPCRADALGLGVLGAIALRIPTARDWILAHRRWLTIVTVCAFGGVVVFHLRPGLHVRALAGYSWLALFYLLLLLCAVVSPGPVARRLLGARILVGLGGISYAVYMFHVGFRSLLWAVAPALSRVLVSLSALFLTIAVAALSWRFFEGPLVRWAHRRFHYGS